MRIELAFGGTVADEPELVGHVFFQLIAEIDAVDGLQLFGDLEVIRVVEQEFVAIEVFIFVFIHLARQHKEHLVRFRIFAQLAIVRHIGIEAFVLVEVGDLLNLGDDGGINGLFLVRLLDQFVAAHVGTDALTRIHALGLGHVGTHHGDVHLDVLWQGIDERHDGFLQLQVVGIAEHHALVGQDDDGQVFGNQLAAADVDQAVHIQLHGVAVDDLKTAAVVGRQAKIRHFVAVLHHFEIDKTGYVVGFHRTEFHTHLCHGRHEHK